MPTLLWDANGTGDWQLIDTAAPSVDGLSRLMVFISVEPALRRMEPHTGKCHRTRNSPTRSLP
jgi:hypothetical protein